MIPGLCRLAIEAACIEAVRRRRLAAASTTRTSRTCSPACSGTKSYVALALFDDADSARATSCRASTRSRREAADIFRVLQRGRARAWRSGARVELVRRSEKLAQWLQG